MESDLISREVKGVVMKLSNPERGHGGGRQASESGETRREKAIDCSLYERHAPSSHVYTSTDSNIIYRQKHP